VICVADASVAVKWFIAGAGKNEGEDHLDQARELLRASWRGEVDFLQPPHFLAEVAAVLARLKPGAAREDIRDLTQMDIHYAPATAAWATAIDLAVRLQHHLFDTLYHALALETPGAVLVTADRRYYDKAREIGRLVWLGDFEVQR